MNKHTKEEIYDVRLVTLNIFPLGTCNPIFSDRKSFKFISCLYMILHKLPNWHKYSYTLIT